MSPWRTCCTVRTALSPRVGEVVRRAFFFPRFYGTDSLNIITGLLKLSDETDLDVLNNAMEDMVEQFEEELLPVATELASRLVSIYNPGGSMPSADASMWQV